jgi:HEAT repeat protein
MCLALLVVLLTRQTLAENRFVPLDAGEAAFIEGLRSPEILVRQETRAALSKVEHLPFLLRVLECRDEPAALREEATWAVYELGTEAAPAVSLLVVQLVDPDPDLRSATLQTLARIGPDAWPAVPLLLDLLRDPDSSFRVLAIRSLRGIGVENHEVVAGVGALVEDPDRVVRAEAVWVLADTLSGEDRLPHLRAAIEDPDDLIAEKACQEFLRMGGAIEGLLPEFLRAGEPRLRRRAIEYSVHLPPAQALPIVRAGLDDADPEVLEVAIGAVVDRWALSSEFAGCIARIAATGEGRIRILAVTALGKIRVASDSDVEVLVVTSRSSDRPLALAAIQSLCTFSGRYACARERLREVVREADDYAARLALSGVLDLETILLAARARFGKTRLTALADLGSFGGDPAAVRRLLEVFQREGIAEKTAVVGALGRMDPLLPSGLDCLLEASRLADRDLKRNALWALSRQAKVHPAARERLEEVLAKDTPEFRRVAFSSLCSRRVSGVKRVLEMIAGGLGDPVLGDVAEDLARWERKDLAVSRVLEDLVDHGRGRAAIRAARALGWPDARACGVLPGVIEDLRSPRDDLRLQAASVLCDLRMPDFLAAPAVAALRREDLPRALEVQVNRELFRNLALAQAALPDLVRMLRSAGSGTVPWVLSLFGWHGPNAAFAAPALIPFLRHEHESVRVAAARALIAFGPEAAMSPSVRAVAEKLAVRAPQPEVDPGVEAAMALFDETGDPDPVVVLLRGRVPKRGGSYSLGNARAFARRSACLVRLGPAAAEFLPAMTERLAESHPWEVAGILPIMASIGPASVPHAAHLLRHENPGIRFIGVRLLGMLGPAAADYREDLLALTAHDMLEFRAEAAYALASVAPLSPSTVAALITLLDDPAFEVRAIAAASLSKIGPAARAAVPALGKATLDEHIYVCELAVQALRRIRQD